MGFSGVMMIATIYFLYKFVASLVKMIRWKSIGQPAIGTIGEAQRVMNVAPSQAPSNNYDLHIEYEGGSSNTRYHINQAKYIEPGTQLSLLFDPTSKDYAVISELKAGVVGYLLASPVSFSLVVVCFLMVVGIQ